MHYNPYDYQFPVHTDEMFFGRRELLDEFIHAFTHNPRLPSYYLIGGRRIGKTSLLHALVREMSLREPQADPFYALTLYMDMQYETINSRTDFFICVQRLLEDALQTHHPDFYEKLTTVERLPRLTETTHETKLLAQFEQAFTIICQTAVQEDLGPLRIVLLIDESERLLGKSWAMTLLDNLRALLSNRLATRSRLSVIMAGASDFYSEISGEGSPLRNILGKKLLSGLEIEAALRLVAEPTHGQLSIEVNDEILRQTGGHPYLTQYIMHHLWENDALASANVAQVQTIARTIWNTPETLEDWCADIGSVSESLYDLIQAQEGWLHRSTLFEQSDVNGTPLRRALEALAYHGIVHHDPKLGYQRAGMLFRDWFVAFHTQQKPPNVPKPPAISFHEFELLVTTDGQIRATSETGGEIKAALDLELNSVGLTLSLIHERRTNAQLLKNLGATLYNALFPKAIHAHWRATLAQAELQNSSVRLRLNLESPDLAALPWELLYDAEVNTFLATNTQTVISRYLTVRQPHRPLDRSQLPLRILVIIASPTDWPELDTQAEKELIHQALAQQLAAGQVELDLIAEQTTLQNINQKLNTKAYHVIHFIGHAYFRNGQGAIVLEDEHQQAHPVNDETFGNLFLNHRSLRLAVLNACQGATLSDTRAFAGIAPHLIQQGVPSVAAMQYPIQDRTALHFSAEFYRTLAAGWPIDAAIQAARHTLSLEFGLGEPDFATPVLFMRAAHGIVMWEK